MRQSAKIICGLCVIVSFVTPSLAQLPAFPGAEGFGRFATGARTNLAAANVYHVTNLNDSGPGSFRDAVSQSNRFVVFDVGGIANINSVIPVASNVTIAGQTAPGGFTIYNDRISFTNSHNLISRHFAVRKGQAGVRDDAASIARGTNMIFDHMSITWGVDGTFDINPDSGFVIDNITIQNSVIAQGLDRLGHSTGGLMQPGSGGSVSVIKSLWADNVTRNPKVRDENEFINNVVYGWETAAYIMGDTTGTSNANVEGNYFIEGPIDGSGPFSSGTSSFHIYANDNWVDPNRNGTLDGSLITSYPGADVVGTRHAFPTTATLTAQQAVTHVMENAGPSIIRDAVDTRLMQEVASYGTLGGVIMRETDLFPGFGSDPTYLNPRARFTDADNDGIADNWETAHGLSPANAADWKGLNATGYTRLEEYVNELGAAGTTVNSVGGVWTTPATWTGGTPTLADNAFANGIMSITSGNGFARRLNFTGSMNVSGGTLDVFDTATVNGPVTINGGVVTAGRVLLGTGGQSGSLAVNAGGTLQTGTVASAGGTASMSINGGTFRATGAPDVKVATALGAAGATFDNNGYNGEISGPISGSGGITKRGLGDLRLSGSNSYAGPTVIEKGSVTMTNASALGGSSEIDLQPGTILNATLVPGGLGLANGRTLSGGGRINGNLTTGSGAVVRPQGVHSEAGADYYTVGIQAESLALGSNWAEFNNALYGTGNGGSYNGADLDGGGIIMVSGESLSAPVAPSGIASTTINVPASGAWYLFAKVAAPTVSGVTGDSATHPGGNNSFYVSNTPTNLAASASNFNAVQSQDAIGDQSRWALVSPTLTALSGVDANSLDKGIDYNLTNGMQTFAIGAREVGTILDKFVLTTKNLTAAELNAVASGPTAVGASSQLTVNGNFTLGSGSTLEIEIGSGEFLNSLDVTGTADLAGNLMVELVNGFVPTAIDSFTFLTATTLQNTFANLPNGSRVDTVGGLGSFLVSYSTGAAMLSDFQLGIAGDFNGDGMVDAADYVVWRNGANPTQQDYNTWRSNFGQSGGGGASASDAAGNVPEPAAVWLASWAMLALVSRRGWRFESGTWR